jgi:hypothetical protein
MAKSHSRNHLTSEEILAYLFGEFPKNSAESPIWVKASRSKGNLIFYSKSRGGVVDSLVLGAECKRSIGRVYDRVSIIPYDVNQSEARRFLENHVQNDEIFEDSGRLRNLKQMVHSWRNLLLREPLPKKA